MQNQTLQQVYKLRQELKSKDSLISLYRATSYAMDDVLVETEQKMKDYKVASYIMGIGLLLNILVQIFTK